MIPKAGGNVCSAEGGGLHEELVSVLVAVAVHIGAVGAAIVHVVDGNDD